MYLAPDAELDDGLLEIVMISSQSKLRYLRGLPRVFKGTHLQDPAITLVQAREVKFHADRPFTAYADGDPIGDLPLTVRVAAGLAAGGGAAMIRLAAGVAAAKAVGTLARTAGRGGGTSLPGKVLTRVEPHAIGRLASRLERGSVVISATNGKTTTAAMVGVDPRAHRRPARPQPRRREHGRRRRQRARRRVRKGGRALTATSACSRSTSSGSAPVVEELEPRAMLLGNLFRDQLDRYGELETIADRWAEIVRTAPALVLNADDPLVADLGRHAPQPTYFGVDDDSLAVPELQHASDSKHCRRCGHAYEYTAIYLAHLGHYRVPELRPGAPASRASRPPTSSCAASAPPHSRCAERARRAAAPRPLQRLQRARRRRADAQPGRRRSTTSSPACRPSSPRSAAPRRSTLGRPTSILLVKNPAGANEVLRTLALEGKELDLLGVLNDRTADGRDVSWVWDADWELLVGSVRRFTASGTRAAELALRMKYAGLDDRPDPRRRRARTRASTRRSHDGDGPLYVVPTYTALLELRELLTRRGQAEAYWR